MSTQLVFDTYYTNYLTDNSIHVYSPSTIDKIKSVTFKTKSTVVDFFKKPETKISALVGYWAAETTFTVFAIYAFMVLNMYGAAIAAAFLIMFLTYGTFGVINEAVK